jgi:hypothetical protein
VLLSLATGSGKIHIAAVLPSQVHDANLLCRAHFEKILPSL